MFEGAIFGLSKEDMTDVQRQSWRYTEQGASFTSPASRFGQGDCTRIVYTPKQTQMHLLIPHSLDWEQCCCSLTTRGGGRQCMPEGHTTGHR